MIEVITPASDTKLTTLAIVKEELGITGTSEDGLLNRLIDEASDIIVRYTDRWFVRETVKETIPGYGYHIISLTRTPILSLSSVKFNGVDVDAAKIKIYDPDAGLLFSFAGPFIDTGLWTHGIEPVYLGYGEPLWEFTYDGGYDPPSATSPTKPLPGDIVRACTDIVKWLYRVKSTDPSIIKRTLGEASETRMQQPMPPTITLTLDRWKRMA